MKNYILKLLLIIDDRVIDNDSNSIDTELARSSRHQTEIEFLRINI